MSDSTKKTWVFIINENSLSSNEQKPKNVRLCRYKIKTNEKNTVSAYIEWYKNTQVRISA